MSATTMSTLPQDFFFARLTYPVQRGAGRLGVSKGESKSPLERFWLLFSLQKSIVKIMGETVQKIEVYYKMIGHIEIQKMKKLERKIYKEFWPSTSRTNSLK